MPLPEEFLSAVKP